MATKELMLRLLTRLGRILDQQSYSEMDTIVSEYGIDPSEFADNHFSSFNDFFIRKLKPECRPIVSDPKKLAIKQRCPSVVLNAATDDLKCYARDPADLCNLFPIAAEELKRHAGVALNPSKSRILLAPGVPDLALDRLPEGTTLSDEDGTRFVLLGAGARSRSS